MESQSTCPFQAFARYRLHVDAWPATSEGLTRVERGKLLHAALAALWNDLGSQAVLSGLDEAALTIRVAAAVESARSVVDAVRWRRLPLPIAEGETRRLGVTVRAWLDHVERTRPPFVVTATEASAALMLGGVELRLRIDRLDTLTDGGVMVIDYKSGRAASPYRWFAARPTGTQLGVYLLALRQLDPDTPLRGAAYAQLKAGAIAVAGIVSEANAWPGLAVPGETRGVPDSWIDVEHWFATHLDAIAGAFRSGDAAVAPRDAAACRDCDLKPLCRIRVLDDRVTEEIDGDG